MDDAPEEQEIPENEFWTNLPEEFPQSPLSEEDQTTILSDPLGPAADSPRPKTQQKSALKLNDNFKCDFCGESFSNKRKITKHLQQHIDLRPQCHICRARLKNNSVLFRHLKRHFKFRERKNRIHECDFCGKVFRHWGNFKRHGLIHTGGNFMCEYCAKSFTQKAQLQYHILYHHFNIREYSCQVCGKSYTTKANLTSHVKRSHEDGPVFECEFCGKKSKLAWTHRNHVKTHTGGDFYCQHCGKNFIKKGELVTHMNSHCSPSKMYECGICFRQYSRKENKRKHMITEHNLKEFSCRVPSCGKTFVSESQLKNHKVEHAADESSTHQELVTYRPVLSEPPAFPCMICTAGFDESVMLRRHFIINHRTILGQVMINTANTSSSPGATR